MTIPNSASTRVTSERVNLVFRTHGVAAHRGIAYRAAGGLVVAAMVLGCTSRTPSTHVSEPPSTAAASMPREVMTPSQVPMLILAGGTYSMGSDQGQADERPRHAVRVDPFAMDRFEVTQDQYAQLQLPNPAHFKGERRPVEQVRWSDAVMFCNERSRKDGLEPCYDEATFACNFAASGYRLPTEAEWEYAARAGIDAEFPATELVSALDQHACYAVTSGAKTAPVGQHKANAWGIHDLLGNVAEWCHDAYAADYYAVSPPENPVGPEGGDKRVLRGGSWKSTADQCRPVARLADDSGMSDACFAQNTYGFRCVRRLSPEELSRLPSSQP